MMVRSHRILRDFMERKDVVAVRAALHQRNQISYPDRLETRVEDDGKTITGLVIWNVFSWFRTFRISLLWPLLSSCLALFALACDAFSTGNASWFGADFANLIMEFPPDVRNDFHHPLKRVLAQIPRHNAHTQKGDSNLAFVFLSPCSFSPQQNKQ
jgi:hypothetical protein